jgi:predicted metal-dependent hydrolase
MLHSGKVQVESALLFETPEQIYARVFRVLRPRTQRPDIRVEFRPFANANSSVRIQDNRMHVRIADVLEGAPAPVMEALAYILLCKLFRRPVPRIYTHRYRLYLNRREMRRSLHLVRQTRGRKFLTGPQGTHYHLDEIFEELNARHFNGLLARPTLSWSLRPSRSVLGHYDPSHNAIVISRLLDGTEVPHLAVEYVLFHEMLHLRCPADHKGSQRRVHTREFRAAERGFPGLKQAKELIKRLSGSYVS